MKRMAQLSFGLLAILACTQAFGFADGFDSTFELTPSNLTPQVNSQVSVFIFVVFEEGGNAIDCVPSSTPTIAGWNNPSPEFPVLITMPATPGIVTLRLTCTDSTFNQLSGFVNLTVVP